MAAIEFEAINNPATVRREATHQTSLAAGAKVKMEIGNDDLDVVVPAGKKWNVVSNIRIIEEDS